MLAFLASGLSITSLAVGAALAGAVADIGLVLAVCLLRRQVDVLRGEFIRKCLLLLAACLVLLLFVRDGLLSYTGVGLLMALFVLFVLENIVYQRRFIYGEGLERDTLLSARASSVPGRRPARRRRRHGAFPGHEHRQLAAQPGRRAAGRRAAGGRGLRAGHRLGDLLPT